MREPLYLYLRTVHFLKYHCFSYFIKLGFQQILQGNANDLPLFSNIISICISFSTQGLVGNSKGNSFCLYFKASCNDKQQEKTNILWNGISSFCNKSIIQTRLAKTNNCYYFSLRFKARLCYKQRHTLIGRVCRRV